jgi:hypothetical protein
MLNRRSFHLGLAAAGLTFARARAQPGVSIPFQEWVGKLVVNVRVDGQGPYSFRIDTGAPTGSISSSLANTLRLPYAGVDRDGRGDQFPVLTVDRLDIADQLTMRGLRYIAIPDGAFTQGSIGSGLLIGKSALVDFDRGMIDFPGDHTGFTALNTRFDKIYPMRIMSNVTLDGVTLPTMWDTGNPEALQVSSTIAQQLGLWRDYVPYAPVRFGHIGGGDAGISRFVRATSLEIGPYTFEQPLVLLRNWQVFMPVVMGLAMMKTMNFAVDPNGGMFIRRNAQAPETPRYPRSGIWLDGTGAGVVAADVGYGSPAARAGVQVGDVLAGVSGLEGGKALISGPVGKTVSLPLLRNGQQVKAQFQLEDYL